MSQPKYESLSQLEHILKRSAMYIGSITLKTSEELIAIEELDGNKTSFKLEKRDVEFSDGFLRLFIEIISNAIDNVWRSSKTDTPCTKIKVSVNQETGEIRVLNDGQTIPIEINEKTKLYNPEMIFGKLLTGSNYNDDEKRLTSGLNGLGAKLTNIFSKEFKIDCIDNHTHKRYQQTFSNNMHEKSKPKISKNSKKGYTEISYKPDYCKFKMSGISNDLMNLLRKYTIEMAMLTKVNVYFNDKKIPVKSLLDYIKLYKNTKEHVYIKTNDSEVILLPSTEGFEQISYINGINTLEGGVHVDSWMEKLLRPIFDKYKKQITMKELKQYVNIYVNTLLPNPTFNSQTKMKLASPKPNVLVEDKHTKAMLRWPTLKESLDNILKSRELNELKSTEKKSRAFKKIKGYDPANFAGKSKSKECILILSEGLSAMTFAVKGIKEGFNGKKGRDYLGILALKGKVLNTRNASTKQITNNTEITNIIQILNLKHGKDYTKEENYNDLNYGKIMLLTDADADGYHISGLILNFIHSMFPSLVKRGDFLLGMMTPIVNITLGKQIHRFYTLKESEEFIKRNEGKNLKVKYLKGLGSSTDSDIKQTFGKRMLNYLQDNETDKTINKVFNNKNADERKRWMEEYDNTKTVELDTKQTYMPINISEFLDLEMIKFSIDDCLRSIPNIYDGLKQSQRKILYASQLKGTNKLKVSQLAGFVSERTNYHHGENSLNETIIKMAQNFVGSNNIPLLEPEGQFGSRTHNGKDAASPRYIFTRVDRIVKLIFPEIDNNLLDYINDDGDIVEPEYYVPIIPMILCNGVTGIGSGWSSNLPSYNPKELIQLVRSWLNNTELPEILPYYKGYTGTITKKEDKKYQVEGKFESMSKKGWYRITEIPVQSSIDSYKETLEDLLEAKKIKTLNNYSDDERINFEIQVNNDFKPTLDNLKLKSSIHTSNMVMFTDGNKLKKFDNINEIVNVFCAKRLGLYKERKEAQLKQLKYDLMVNKNKHRFLEEVMSDKLHVFKVDEEEIISNLKKREYEMIDEKYDYLLNMNVRKFSKQEIEKLIKEIKNIIQTIEKLEGMDIKDIWRNELKELENKI